MLVWMPSSSGWRLCCHQIRDDRAPVAALRDELRVSQALHQRRPRRARCAPGPSRSWPACRRTRSPASTESPRGRRPLRLPPCAVGLISGSTIFSCCEDRAGPAVRDDERQRVLVLRADVDEMDVQPIDLGDELRQRVQPRLDLAPVVFRRPVARELPASSRAARPANRPRRFPSRAIAWRRCAGEASFELGVGGTWTVKGRIEVLAARSGAMGEDGFFGCGGHGRFPCMVVAAAPRLVGGGGWRAPSPRADPPHRPCYRRDLNPARSSFTNSSGCSQAAKCPPLSSLL